MSWRRYVILAALLVFANCEIGVWGYVRLPAWAVVAFNYGIDGRPHAFLPKAEGLAVLPIVAVVVTAALAFGPRRARQTEGLAAAEGPFGLLIMALAALLLVAEAALIAQAMSPDFDVLRWVFLATAVVLMLVGNSLGKVRHNHLFGVRTRFTLADKRVWDKTQRFSGRLMVLGALALAAATAFMPDHPLMIVILVLAAAGPPIAGAVYSARLARQT